MMPTMATRRAASSAGPGFVSQRSRRPRWRASSGRITSFETMVPRARVATMIMPVAADRPPRKATKASSGQPSARGIATRKVSGCTAPSAKSTSPTIATGSTKTLMATR